MALTQTQKYTILRYLGWPLKTIDPTSLSFSNIITARLTGFPTDAEDILGVLLARIAEVDDQLEKMVARSNVKSVDDIEFFENGTHELRRERSKVIRELAVMTDIAFGPGFYSGMTSISL